MNRIKSLFFLQFFSVIFLFLYSFTQIDLSLTLSKLSIWQAVEKSFQQIGYFQRPLATQLYILILALLFASYLFALFLSFKNSLTRKQIWILIIGTAVILTFSYNAFSYDIFNYIFDAKIITHYHQNPYLHKALDYPGDPMLSFMQWTHRTYPYGFFWLVLTVPLSFLGLNIFLPTFFLFKALASIMFIGTAYFMEKTLKVLKKNESFGLVFFALNPLVIIESLVSSHNDIAMMFFAVLGIYLYFNKKFISSFVSVIISGLVKSVTIVLLGPIVLRFIAEKMNMKVSDENFLRLVSLSVIAGFIYALTKLEIQPWYFLWILPFLALLKPNKYIISLAIGFSLGLLLRYTVYLIQGNWDGWAVPARFYLTYVTFALFMIPPLLLDLKNRFASK